MALGFTIVLTIFVVAMIGFTSSSSRNARLSASDLTSRQYAEAGLNAAYSMIVNQKTISGGNPSAANLLGCNGASGATDTTGPSNCSSPTPKVFCITASSGCSAGTSGSASVFGFFSGANPATYNGITVPASTWYLTSTGYALNPNTNAVDAKATSGEVTITPINSGAVAAVWNHMFITSPLTSACSVDFGGNGELITDPLYVIGNLCLSGQNVSIQEAAGGQPVDLMVGGKLVLSGSGTNVGIDSSHKIYSGVVVGGCTTVSVTSSTSPCAPAPASPAFNYYVKNTDTFVANDAPQETTADMANDYATFDPGPKHTCLAGTTPAPLADAAFDSNLAASNEPDISGSTTAGTSFELVPNFSYACISKNGASTGYLIWNNGASSITVANVPTSGQNLTVPSKTLAINGSIFFDSNLTISQTATYSGTAAIEAAGTITFNGNATTLCAVANCVFTNWQGTSGNNSMLTLAALQTNVTAITFTNNSQTFQGSLWCQPSSKMTFVKNGVTVEGPIAIGSFDNSFNNATFDPLPIIKNMPVGAPLPPNTGVSVGPLITTK
jgi:Tfp pilus assembly protein PilX